MNHEDLFRQDVPHHFLVRLQRGVVEAYEQAHAHVEKIGLARPEKRNLLPWMRRELIEHHLRRAALETGEVAHVETECSGFWHHVVVDFKRVRITQCSNPDVNSPLRYANYKRDYARQQLLPGFDSLDDSPRIYAVVLHHGEFESDSPDFVVVRFPEPDLKSFYPEIIDLNVECAKETSEIQLPVEVIDDVAIPKIKLKKTRKAAGEK